MRNIDTFILGESFSNNNNNDSFAISFSNAKAPGGNIELDDSKYVTAMTVNKLAEEVMPPVQQNLLEAVEEIPSTTTYYDGSLSLNSSKIDCQIFTNAHDCASNNVCGWCGSSNTCISGTKYGPLSNCVQTTYLFGIRSLDRTIVNIQPKTDLVRATILPS